MSCSSNGVDQELVFSKHQLRSGYIETSSVYKFRAL